MQLKFEVYRNGERLTAFRPVGACAVGPESVPTAGEVSFRDGYLIVETPDDEPVGVSLLWDTGQPGQYQLETTRLPPRDRPYNLNLELLRQRLMKIIQKQEDWNLFDMPGADDLLNRCRQVQDTFAEALSRQHDPAAAARLADEALPLAVDLSEDLARFHSELLLNRRRAANGFVRHIFGCRVDVGLQNQKYRDMLTAHFDYAVLPTPWKLLQPQETDFDTRLLDTWSDALARRRLPIIAGPLVNLDETEIPDWMFIFENDFDTLRELAYEHVNRLVQKYRRTVNLWNVVGGLCTNRAFHLSFEQIIELTRLLVSQVKNILPAARTLVTVSHPFGEYHARNTTSVAPLLYAEMVAQAGINFDGFAIELELGVPEPGMFMRDLFQLSALLDRFSPLGRPVFITAIGSPGRWTPDSSDRSEGRLDPAAAGRWKKPWDPHVQADWLEAVYNIALSKPFVESVAWGNLVDINQTLPGGGLLDDMYQPKPAFERLQQMRAKIQQWSGRAQTAK